MELIIKSVNLTENTQIIKSINWEYGNISGCQEVPNPNPREFIEFSNLTNEIVKGWLLNIVDFSQFEIIEPIQEVDKIITLEI
jgi:hypothetical protein